MRSRWLKISVATGLAGGVILFGFVNCDQVRLSRLTSPEKIEPYSGITRICTSAPTTGPEAIVATKIVFLVDASGSNFSGNDARGIGTDPDKSYRVGKISAFVSAYTDNNALSYSLISFQARTATPLVLDPVTNLPIFTQERKSMSDALTGLYLAPDENATPYAAALTMAKNLITSDRAITSDPARTRYVVLLMSDGAPTDYGSPPTAGALADVDVIKGIGPNISVSTLYYGPEQNALDKDAVQLLADMAKQGGGKFLNTNVAGRESSINSLIPIHPFVPRVIKRFMLTNLSSAPCDDGTMGPDSDGDGICDRDEEKYNEMYANDAIAGPRMNGNYFSPTNRNSFGNNYSDYFNALWVRYGVALDRSCGGVKATAHDLITDCEKSFINSKSSSGPTGTWTTRMGTSADPKNFDSDGDGFLDSIETIYGRTLAAAMDYGSGSNLKQGFRFDEILMQHRHPGNPAGTPSAAAYDPDFRFVGPNDDGQNCYTYTQTILPLEKTLKLPAENTAIFPQMAHAAGENVVFVYYIEVPENDFNSPGELHYLYRKLKFGSSISLQFAREDFEVYEAKEALVNQLPGQGAAP